MNKIYPESSDESFCESMFSYFLPEALDLNADTGAIVFLTFLNADLNFLKGRAMGGVVMALFYTLWLTCLARILGAW
jgi:hypothetical protein